MSEPLKDKPQKAEKKIKIHPEGSRAKEKTEEITHYLRDMQYEPLHSREMTLTLCEVIRTRVKELMIPRYKTVILVHIGQLNGQGMQISSRCLWDPNFDTFVSHSFKNTSLFCSATVYGIYFE
uniref:Dynein light chain Tctex-type family member 5 n=1 Tax=Poecilia latipinna TaxID=48699 RepID=A0A3B3TZE4_9TELE